MAASLPAPARLNPCHAVILRAPGSIVTKRLKVVDGGIEVVGGQSRRFWDWSIEPLGGLDDIERMLWRLAGDPSAMVVGDAVRRGAGPRIRRSTDDEDGGLERRDRRWFAMDCDGWTPPGWPLGRDPDEGDIIAAVTALRDTLPGLKGASCVYRLSSTAGLVKTDEGGIRRRGWGSLRCHLWFWFDRAVAPASVRSWLAAAFPLGVKGTGSAPAWDHGMLDAVRPHYVADPVCEGLPDPVTLPRIGRLTGHPAVAPAEWVTLTELEAARAAADEAARAARAAAQARLAQITRAYAPGQPSDDEETILKRRMRGGLAGRMKANVESAGNASSPSSATAYTGALKALTVATALETLGEVGAVSHCEAMLRAALLTVGKSQAVERTIEKARKGVDPRAVADSIEGARRAYELRWRDPAAHRPRRLTGTPALDPLPDDVPGLHREILGRLSRDWPAELVRELGFGVLEEAAYLGARVILADEGDPCRVYLRRIAASDKGRRLLRRAGLIDAKGRPWGPLAKGAKLTPILPVYGPEGASPRGWATLSGDTCGERWPVGLRWPNDCQSIGPGRSARPLVLVSSVLDAAALGPLAWGLPNADIADALDVVAIGETWRPEWGEVLEGRRCVVLAPLPGDTWAGTVVAAAGAAGVPVTMAGWPRGATAKTWAELDARGVVKRWRQKAREVSDGR